MKVIDCFDGEFAFLSNFYPSPIPISDGVDTFTAPTVEHYFQASKTPSMEEFLDILSASTPGQSKRLGRKCMLVPDWEEVKDRVMYEALRLKFSDPDLKEKLLATEDAWLVEGNTWHDNYWGSCHCDRCGSHGRNKLGQLLMQLREELR